MHLASRVPQNEWPKVSGYHTHQPLCLHLPGAAEVEAPRRNGFRSPPPTQNEGKTVSLNKPRGSRVSGGEDPPHVLQDEWGACWPCCKGSPHSEILEQICVGTGKALHGLYNNWFQGALAHGSGGYLPESQWDPWDSGRIAVVMRTNSLPYSEATLPQCMA